MEISSCSRCSTDLPILDSASLRMPSVLMPSPESFLRCSYASGDQRPDRVAADHPLHVALLQHVEDDDRHPVVHAERQRRVVHDVDAPVQDLHVIEVLELGGGG